MAPHSLDAHRLWDVVVLGAGMGGSFAAHALAEAGYDVLLVEYGNQDLSPPGSVPDTDLHETRLSESKWPLQSAFEIDGVVKRRYSPFGAGVGGSTNLYAAALERFAPTDIDEDPNLGHPTGGWPIRYSELLPFYEQAERQLHVIGTQDPLGVEKGSHILPPPPLGPRDEDFMQLFRDSGLHPYRLHVGIRYRPGCDECIGRLCYNSCRADGRSVLAEGRRQPVIMARTEVLRLESSADRVTAAIVKRDREQFEIRARVFILAAGAIHTPKLLLRSGNEHWPDGLANRSGLVGRNLMLHVALSFVLWPKKGLPGNGPRKSLAFRDFYQVESQRLGAVQSSGFELEYGRILTHLFSLAVKGRWKLLAFLRPFLRIAAAAISRVTGPGTVFVGIIEDMPYPENRVVLDDSEEDGLLIKYTIQQELRDRTNLLCSLLKERLKRRRLVCLSQGVELNFGHPCGTCVMSDDPAKGVVDRDCRAHGIENLFLADASFMPTSAATNPSLTVAANALRVAGKIGRLLCEEVAAAPELSEIS